MRNQPQQMQYDMQIHVSERNDIWADCVCGMQARLNRAILILQSTYRSGHRHSCLSVASLCIAVQSQLSEALSLTAEGRAASLPARISPAAPAVPVTAC